LRSLSALFLLVACGPLPVDRGVCALPDLTAVAPSGVSPSGSTEVDGAWELHLTTSTANSSVAMYAQNLSGGWVEAGTIAGAGSANPWNAMDSAHFYFAAASGEAQTPTRLYFAKIGTTTIRATMVGCLSVDGGALPN